MKVLFTYNYDEKAMDKVKSLGYDVDFIDEKIVDQYGDFSEVEILVCYNPFKKINLREFKKLKLILLSSIGIDQLPKDIVGEMNITVCNNKGGYSIPMGEWIVMKALELVKNSKLHFDNQSQSKWEMDTTALELYDKKIVFFGTGTISFEAVKRLAGFEMEIVGVNTNGRNVEGFNFCVPISDAKEHVRSADVIVIALPSTEKTKGIFGKELMDEMRKHAVLINISRGDIIDEDYLVDVLKNNRIKAAALDVFKNEPLPENHPLWKLDNVILTSHNSWISERRNQRRFNTIYKNLKAYVTDTPLYNIVDIQKGY